MEMGVEKGMLEQCHCSDDEEFFRDILQLPALSRECEESNSLVQNNFTATKEGRSSGCSDRSGKRIHPRKCILSFVNSTIIPAATPFIGYCDGQGTPSSESNWPFSSNKRTLKNLNTEPDPTVTEGGNKKVRSDSQTLAHILAERKRRQEQAEKFAALSAIIPGLKKADKTSIVREAINYVKQLQERVTELEQRQNKRGKDPTIILKKTNLCANEVTTSSETNSEDCCRPSELLPDIKARVFENEVLIEIHCKKENGIDLKIFDLLENLHLRVTCSSVLPFGHSNLSIIIIAQMGNAYRMTTIDLVKRVTQVLWR